MRGFPFTNLLRFFFFWFTTSLAFLAKFSISTDTLAASQILRTNQTLQSADGTFVLGFFPGTNSNFYYLGIWYNKNIDTNTTVVWVANRDNPLQNSTGFLKIGDNGNIVLLNSPDQNPNSNNAVWSSNQTTATNPVVQLLETGNLVLKEANVNDPQKYLWQSFDYPTDTLLPGMKMGWNFDTNTEKHLTSWKNTGEDPSTGDYSFKLDYQGLPEIFLRNDQYIIYRSGPWNGEMEPNTDSIVFSFSSDEHGVYFSFSTGDRSIFSRLVVDSGGELQRLTWVPSSKTWTKFWYRPSDQCDAYKMCGPYGICDPNASPVCECLRGFSTPKNQQAWSLRDRSDGCVRDTDLDCGSDRFLHLDNVKLPETTSVFVNRTLAECGDLCRRNCSCTAYANIYITNGGTGCVMWIGELIDMRQYPDGRGQDLYVRLAASDVGNAQKHMNKRRDERLIIGLTVATGTIIVAIGAYLAIRTHRSRKGTESHGQRVIGAQKQVKLDELPLFDFEVVATATNKFFLGNMLGKGGFGPVYKGLLPDGQEIAVKRLSRTSGQGLEEFMNEVVVISKLQHRNLVKLLGCCIEGDEKMLIYEFMPNKSLDAFIFDPIQRKLLDWTKRFSIIEGIARGLLYLHRDSRLRIIHRDLKASNILLDAEMNPKISDFGLARIHKGEDEDEVNTKRVVGTYGYMSPEYAMEGLFSEKSDVYSFGVMLLEIVSGRRNTSFRNDDQFLSLVGYAWNLWNEDKIRSLIDPELPTSGSQNHILRCVHIAFLCVQEVAKSRPKITTVVSMLNSEIFHLPPPRQVAFVQRQNSSSIESSSQENQSNSNNNVTLSEIQGR